MPTISPNGILDPPLPCPVCKATCRSVQDFAHHLYKHGHITYDRDSRCYTCACGANGASHQFIEHFVQAIEAQSGDTFSLEQHVVLAALQRL